MLNFLIRFIQLPSENAWRIIKAAWNSESDLDIAEILFFLREHTHQMDSKIHDNSCSRQHCHWCAVEIAVCKVNGIVFLILIFFLETKKSFGTPERTL
jgi:hypothetical protein